VSSEERTRLAILENDQKKGEFVLHDALAILRRSIFSIAVDDLDADGDQDIVVGQGGGNAEEFLSVFTQQGDLSFSLRERQMVRARSVISTEAQMSTSSRFPESPESACVSSCKSRLR